MRFAFLFLISLLFVQSGLSLDPSKEISQYGHQIWQSEQGLPQNSILCLFQTRDGYLWIGTQGGLARFDGVKFTNYDVKNSPLQNNDIIALAEDHEGGLWIATYGGGLARFRNGVFTAFGTKDGLSTNILRSLLYDSSGTLWIGTRGGGLNQYSKGKFNVFTTKDGLNSNSIYALGENSEGIWIGTDRGLNLYRNGSLQSFTTTEGLSHNIVRSLSTDSKDRLWIGTEVGLNLRTKNGFANFSSEHGLSNDTIRAVLEDHDGSLWIGSDGGLNRYRNGSIESFTSANALSHDSVYSLLEDHEGNLWIGTDGGGINQLKDVNFTNSFIQKNRDNTIYSVLQDRYGAIWAGTRTNGVIRNHDGVTTEFTTKDGLLNDTVFALHEDRKGTLWIGSRGNGITLISNNRLSAFPGNSELTNNTVRAIHEDRNGSVWIGTNSGLNQWSGSAMKHYFKKDGLSEDFIYCILEDSTGRLWIGTFAGLTLYSDGKFTIPAQGSLAAQSIWALLEDPDGSIWIATYGEGLFRYKNGKFTNYNSRSGLFDDAILGLMQDDFGNLWLSGYRGIFRISKKDLDAMDAGSITHFQSMAFDASDGMKSTECIGGVMPWAARTKDGKLHFPTTRGLTAIDPRKIKTNQHRPPVQIERVVYDESYSLLPSGINVSFPAGSRNFEFHYTALSFTVPSKVKFRYKLEGFDGDWIDAAGRRTGYYAKIPPGDYAFRVIASNNNGVWNETGATFRFRLAPHFYETWYFYSLSVLAFGALVIAIHRLRVRKLRTDFSAVLDERNRISREIHDTLTQDFTGVVLQLEAAEMSLDDNREAAQECVSRAKELARNGLVESRRFVKALRPAALERSSLFAAIQRLANQTSSISKIHVQAAITGKEQKLNPDVEDNLLRITQEALSNIVKHSKATQAEIRLSFQLFRVDLQISDNGSGFDVRNPKSEEGGFGLTSMKERAARIRGNFKITSDEAKGTRIQVKVPAYRWRTQ